MIPTASQEAERDFRERGLTGREADAARSALSGMTAAAAAREMGVSSSTVGSLRQRAYRKLGVSGAVGLVGKYAEKSVDKDAGEKDWRPTLRARGLSETQASVLSLACSGRSTAQIAEELHLAEGTVRAARATGYRMLGVHSREELAALLEREAAAPRRRRAARLAAACLAAVMVIAAVAVTAASYLGSRPPAVVETEFGEVPNVVGMDLQQAWEALVEADFLPIVRQGSVSGAAGTVVSQSAHELRTKNVLGVLDPNGALRHEYDTTPWKAEVIVTVTGVLQIPLELTTNHSEQQARSKLAAAGFTNVSAVGDGVGLENNRVVGVSPAPGAWVNPDDPIELTVSDEVVMPNVIGMGPVEASSVITLSGLVPSPCVDGWELSDQAGWDTPTVLSTSIQPGESVPVGTTIRVEYSGPVEGTAHTVKTGGD